MILQVAPGAVDSVMKKKSRSHFEIALLEVAVLHRKAAKSRSQLSSRESAPRVPA